MDIKSKFKKQFVIFNYPLGRGKNTHAYTHSVHNDHHVFLNLHTLKFYCLPDNYEIIDATLEDIKYVLKPTFTKDEVILRSLCLDRIEDDEICFTDSTIYLLSFKNNLSIQSSFSLFIR